MGKKDIICIATPKFRGNYLKSTVQLMECMSKDCNVLYVDYPCTLKDVFKLALKKDFTQIKKIFGLTDRIEDVKLKSGASLKLLTLPAILPINRIRTHWLFDLFSKWNAYIIRKCLLRQISELGIKNHIVINAFQPFYGLHLMGKLGEEKNIYYCYDNISQASWLKTHGERYENAYIKKADQVVVTSSELLKIKKKLNKNISVIHNGVDFKLFNGTLTNFENKKHKDTIGYLGTVDDRIDVDLIEHLAKAYPSKKIQFIGRCISENVKTRLSDYANVQFTGPQPIEQLPSFIEAMDVCIIPFKCNAFTKAIYPLKVNEYLARGKAVVSTQFSDLSDFAGLIYTAEGTREFLDCVEKALAENIPGITVKRELFAQSNSWSARAKAFLYEVCA